MASSPQITYLYRFFNEADELLYVGITRGLQGRFVQHARDKAWFDEIARSETEQCLTHATALARESTAILTERPKYNKAIPTLARHDVLHKRAEDDPYTAMPLVERLKLAEAALNRSVYLETEVAQLRAAHARLTARLAEETEAAFSARAEVAKLSAAARQAMGMIADRDREISNRDIDIADLKRQLVAARQQPAPPAVPAPVPRRVGLVGRLFRAS
jgi:predicted GIY-YIG superfamily endonuclease